MIKDLQKRLMLLGRVRLGEKGSKGEPRKLTTFRFTSAARPLLEAAAELYGGTVSEWKDAPDGEGYFEVTTKASQLDVLLPPMFSDADGSPTAPYSQFYELWAASGCARRCDGEIESLSGQPCMCDPEKRVCKVTTRVSFMLPDLPGLGVWRMDSHGWNAAIELPGTLDVLRKAAGPDGFVQAVLRIENRTKKVPGEGTRRFIVPVLDLPNVTVKELASGGATLAINGPRPAPPKPQLPPAPPIESEPPVFAEQKAIGASDWGEEPEIEGFAAKVPEHVTLTAKLLGLAGELGIPEDKTMKLVDDNRLNNVGDNAKHVTWLKSQITRAEKKKEATAA